ncbi:MAG TPA: sialidase family protein [Gaiellaceae bacterium]|nr:sialidase family protein [Gaiellaceae bacterium]
MRVRGLLALVALALAAASFGGGASRATSTGVGNVPQGTQTDKAYAQSVQSAHVSNVFATTQQVSCYRPEVAAPYNDGPALGYSGESACPGATTGEDTGAAAPYATQLGSNPGYPMSAPQLVKGHSESDIRVDPTNPKHLIGASKWFVSAEGYNHLLGFYESFDGGKTWPVQGHIPGYEGWTDNTDPIGAFDSYGNYYSFILGYQFFYRSDGSHNYTVGTSQEPNPAQAAEVVSVAVRKHGSTTATQWITTRNGSPDIVAAYDSVGNEPDKQWMTIDTNPASPHFDRVYLMWVNFHYVTPVPYVSYADAQPDGTHTAWSTPQALPEPPHTATGATYLLPHVAPNGDLYTTVTNFDPSHSYCCASIFVDKSTDGGQTFATVGTPVASVTVPPYQYANTTFRDGIENSFAVGNHLDSQGTYPLYVSYEDYSAGVGNVLMTASYDGGATWSGPIQANDNTGTVDEFQPNLSVASDGTVSVAFYDRRLACPAAGSSEGAAAGIGLDPAASGASNYCINASVQFYDAALNPIGHNVRLTQHTWDPQLNAPHTGSPSGSVTFIGDYFGNDASGPGDAFTFVSTYNDGANAGNRQQQVVASIATP